MFTGAAFTLLKAMHGPVACMIGTTLFAASSLPSMKSAALTAASSASVSAYEGEGKSTVAFNLSVLEAESRKRVLLIDANLHRPMLGHCLALGTLLAPLEGSTTLY